MHALLIGNYGVGNLGDELLKEYFLTHVPDVEWTVVSSRPSGADVPRLPFGLRSLFTPWWKTLGAFRRSDAVVFGGGSLWTDTESVRACVLWGWHAWVAWLFRKKIILAFQGIGPFRTTMGEGIAQWVLRKAAFVSVRDAESEDRARAWARAGVLVAAADPVWLMFPLSASSRSSENVLGIIPRENSGEEFFAAVRAAMDRQQPSEVRIISLQPGEGAERQICERLRQEFPRSSIRAVTSLRDLINDVSACSAIITQRYHGAVAAVALGVPCEIVPQVSGDKLDQLRGQNASVLRASAKRGEDALNAIL